MSGIPTVYVSDRLVRYVHQDQAAVIVLSTRNASNKWAVAKVVLCHLPELLFRKLQVEKTLDFPGIQNLAIPVKVNRFDFPDLFFLGVPDSPARQALLSVNANDVIKAVTRALQSAEPAA